MKKIMKPFITIVAILFLTSCASTQMIPINKAKTGKTVKVYLKNGEKFVGHLYSKDSENFIVVSKEYHKKITLPQNSVKRIDYLDEYLDYNGDPISKAEIKKYKGTKQSVTYTLSGIVLGGLGGIVVGTPFWLMNSPIKPLFTGGIGAVAGGIFFSFKGNKRDEEVAVETIRIIREKKEKIQKQSKEKAMELKKLRKIEKEKKQLKESIKRKKEAEKK